MNRLFLAFFLLLTCISCSAEIVQDEVAEKLIKVWPASETYTNYNYESTIKIPVKIKSLENIKSESELYEGQIIEYKVIKDVFYQDKIIIKRGVIVSAKVSIIIDPGMNGIPASIILKDFKIDGIKNSKLTSSYEIFGQDRSLIIYPLKWALTILPPTGSLTNFIKGGHAKIKVKKPITIYYYPEWQ